MNRNITVFSLVILLMLPVAPANAAKIRHLATVDRDEAGRGMLFPTGVACGDGVVLVADSGNGRLLFGQVDPDRDPVLRELRIQAIQSPLAVTRLVDGNFLVLDAKTKKIGKIDGVSRSFGGFLDLQDVPDAGTTLIKSMAADASGLVYLLDVFNRRILVLDAQGRYQRQVPWPPDAGFISDITVDDTGRIYVVDSVTREVFSAAVEAAEFKAIGIPKKAAVEFLTAAENAGTGLFLVDRHQGRLILVGFDGSILEYKLGEGYENGQLRYPSDICLDGGRKLFIADQGNNRIQIFEVQL